MSEIAQWVGRTNRRVDWITPSHLAAWNATLDRGDAFPAEGSPTPPGFHWTLFTPLARQSEIGVDGHPRRGGFLPPVPLPRRMWAGSRLRFVAPIRVGEQVEQVSVIDRVDEKRGKAGSLVFVTVRHTVSGPAGVAIEEEQDIVYREAPPPAAPGAAPPPAEPAPRGEFRREIRPDPVLLFRYSALTFNGHRIHYDRRYVTGVEGYPGLVVHAPLLALLALDAAERRLGRGPASFEYRAVAPLFEGEAMRIEGRAEETGAQVWVRGEDGRTALTGRVE